MIDKIIQHAESKGVFSIHASAVSFGKSAFIFLGPSGTGKSTICQLLRDVADPLADDMIYLFPAQSGKWEVANARDNIPDGPLVLREITNAERKNLKAVFRLHQVSDPYLENICAMDVCLYLMDSYLELSWNRRAGIDIKRNAFSSMAAISKSVETYHLNFDLSDKTVDMIRQISF